MPEDAVASLPRFYGAMVDRERVGGPDVPWDGANWEERRRSRVVDPRRVAAATATGLFDSAPDESFDQLARLAAAVLGVPWVFVTLVDDHRSFWVSAAGIDPDAGTGRYGDNAVSDSFCQYVIGADGPVVIDDARLDPRSAKNASIDSMDVVAWAGFPLRSHDGYVVGTFCAVDRAAREWSSEDVTLLDALASAATSHLQLRAALAAANESARELRAEMERREIFVGQATKLAHLAQELSAVSTVEQVARVVTTTGRDVLDAAFANIAVVDADRRKVQIVHSPPLPAEMADRYSHLELSDDLPLAHAVTRGETILVPDLESLAARYPHALDDTIAAGLGSTASIPLFRSDRTVAGAVGVGWSGPTDFTPMVRSAMTTVSEMCAQALDRSLVGDARTQFVRSLQYALLTSTGLRAGLDIAAEIRGAINALVSLHSNDVSRLFDAAEHQLNLPPNEFVATLCVHIMDTDTNTVEYVSAGHPPALLVDPLGQATLLEAARRPVLGMAGPPPAVACVDFAPGSILVAYTDGLVEQRRDFDHGLQQLSDIVVSARDGTARQISNAIASTITINAPDDIAFAVIRRVTPQTT